MMLLQQVPSVPPIPPAPPFDPNLVFLQDGGPFVTMIVIAALAVATIIFLPIVRALARRLEGKGTGDPALRAEVEQLHSRLSEMDLLHTRVAELEERVDFTERLLAQTHEAQGRVLRGDDSMKSQERVHD